MATGSEGPYPLAPAGKTLLVIYVLFILLTTLTVALRFWSKHLKGTSLHLEDYFVLTALFIFYGYTGAIVTGTVLGGVGHHLVELDMWRLQVILKTTLAIQFTYALGIGFVKCSICLLLARIFPIRNFKILCWIVMGICAAWSLMTILIGAFLCTPIAFNWDRTIPGGHCGNQNIGYAFVGVIDIITDICIITLPQRLVWKLQLPTGNKIALGLLFALGSLTIITSILRVIVILKLDFNDFSFAVKDTEVWTTVEFGTSIMVSCGPLLRPVFEKVYRGVSSSLRYASGSNRTKNNSSHGSHITQTPKNTGFALLNNSEIALKPIQRPYPGTVTTNIQAKSNVYRAGGDGWSLGETNWSRNGTSNSRNILARTQTSTTRL